MILEEMSNFLGNFALIGTSETWNHIKIFTKLEGCFKNQVPIESEFRSGNGYD